MDLPRTAKLVVAARLGAGAAAFAAPRLAARVLGIPSLDLTPAAILFVRLFGVREIGLGLISLGGAADPGGMRRLLHLNAAVDAGDAVALVVAAVAAPALRRAAFVVVPGALVSVAGHVREAQALA